MVGLGTVLNVAGIVAGGALGRFCGRLLKERYQDTLNVACGVSVLFIGIAGALEGIINDLNERGTAYPEYYHITQQCPAMCPAFFIKSTKDIVI